MSNYYTQLPDDNYVNKRVITTQGAGVILGKYKYYYNLQAIIEYSVLLDESKDEVLISTNEFYIDENY